MSTELAAVAAEDAALATPAGLTTEEAARRLAVDGPNRLAPPVRRSPLRMIAPQLLNPLVLLLLFGAVVSAFVGHLVDAVAIGVIVSINAVVGFAQEMRAEQALVALRKLTAPRATVLRDGRPCVVDAATIVRGDVLVLEPGDIVAADAELSEAHNLATNEATLTGESLPVDKAVGPSDPAAPVAERRGHVFAGTAVATGLGRAAVIATGHDTEVGQIADALASEQTTKTPLQQRLEQLGRVVVVVCVVLVAVVAAITTVRGLPWLDVLLTSISLAVAAVPEGLPAVITISMAVGVHRLTHRGILIRRLSAVETLGSATVICTDKTGTLTHGVLEVVSVWGDAREVLHAAAAGSTAELHTDGSGSGDATELALLRAAAELGIHGRELEAAAPVVDVTPFDAATRRMEIRREDGKTYIKGAFEAVAPACGSAPDDAAAAHDRLAADGLRVLAVAVAEGGEPPRLLGLVGMADRLREEAREAIARARRAGIRVVMITGDHPETAHAIARELRLADDEQALRRSVYARATAADKQAIVTRLQAAGEVVAMTGDGVNDAPSIKRADIGVAMGKAATEVTREAADMVLTTDSLASMIEAVAAGRVIFANIRKTVVYLLGGNASELLLVLAAAAAGLPMPLLPLHLLWINLLGEPLPGIALSIDPPATDVLDETPRGRGEPLLRRREWVEVVGVAVLQAAIVGAAFMWALPRYHVTIARTLTLSALVFGVVFRALASRSSTSIYWLDIRSGLRLAGVVATMAALQLTVVYLPPLQSLLGVAALPLPLLAGAIGLGLVPVTVLELLKVRNGARGEVGPDTTGGSSAT